MSSSEPELFSYALPVTTGRVNRNMPQELFRQPLPVFFPDGLPKSEVTDDDVSPIVGNPASKTRAALNAAYPQRTSYSVAVLGDSITAKGVFAVANANISFNDDGFWTWASIALGQRMRLTGLYGYSGQQTSIILSHVQSAINSGAAWLVEEGGTNDVTNDVPAATIQANKLAIWKAALAAGMNVVATTIIPQASWTAARRLNAQQVNQWIRAQARTLRGVYVCAWDVPLTDPATGNALTGMVRAADGIHPSPTGASLMGQRLAAVLDRLLPPLDTLQGGGDPTNPLPNGAMTGNSGGVSTGWTVKNLALGATTAVSSKVPRTDDVPGEWQQVVVASGDAGGLQFYRTITTGYAVGDVVSGYLEYQRGNDWAGMLGTGNAQFRLRLQCLGSGYYGYGPNHIGPEVFPVSALAMPLSGVIRTPAFVVPPGTTGIIFGLEFAGQGTVRIGRSGIRVNQESATPIIT